jgi:hypothetical protein
VLVSRARNHDCRRQNYEYDDILFLHSAGDVGIEPTITVLETVVIPLHQSPLRRVYPKDAFLAYFLASLKTTCLRSFLLYFLSSILRVTSLRFLRVQYTSPVAACFKIMRLSCDISPSNIPYKAFWRNLALVRHTS